MSAGIGVFELRQYTLRPGRYERLATLFDRAFVEPQEALGIVLPGQFRDLDDPDRFVWLRGFADMEARGRALAAFYGGPVWQAHREQANATMLDSDDVLMLRPWQAFDLDGLRRPAPGAVAPSGRIAAMVCPIDAERGPVLARTFDETVRPWLAERGLEVLASGLSEAAPNNFPRLPVRESEPVFAWFAAVDASGETAPWPATLLAGAAADPFASWVRGLAGTPQHLRLAPTPRSLWRGTVAAGRAAPAPEATA